MSQTKPPMGARIDGSSRLGQGLVGCWLFNEGAGMKAFDCSGLGNHGTLTGMANPSSSASGWTGSQFGKGLAFDGTNDYVAVLPGGAGSTGLIKTVNDWSVSVWMKPHSVNQNGFVFQTGNPLNFGFGIGAASANEGTGSRLRAIFDGVAWCITSYAFVADTWAHVVASRTGGTLSFWVNRAKQASTFATIPNQTIGNVSNIGMAAGARGFNGWIENHRVYNRALSQAEISELYRNPYAGISMPTRQRARLAATAARNSGFFWFM